MLKKILLIAVSSFFYIGFLFGMKQVEISLPAAVKKISASDWPDKSKLTRCKEGLNKSELFFEIQPNNVVTLYASNPSRCIAFDPYGIAGDELTSSPPVLAAMLINAINMCATNDSRIIAREADAIASEADTEVAIKCWGLESFLPGFYAMVDRLIQNGNLPKLPIFSIEFNNKTLYPVCLFMKKDGNNIIAVHYAFLQETCDNEQACTIANILMYIKQDFLSKSKNNKEALVAMADIATVLVMGNPCYAVYLHDNLHDNGKSMARKELMLTMYEHYKRARELLLLTEED